MTPYNEIDDTLNIIGESTRTLIYHTGTVLSGFLRKGYHYLPLHVRQLRRPLIWVTDLNLGEQRETG